MLEDFTKMVVQVDEHGGLTSTFYLKHLGRV